MEYALPVVFIGGSRNGRLLLIGKLAHKEHYTFPFLKDGKFYEERYTQLKSFPWIYQADAYQPEMPPN